MDAQTFINAAGSSNENTQIVWLYNNGGIVTWNHDALAIRIKGIVATGPAAMYLTTNPSYTFGSFATSVQILTDVLYAQNYGGWQQVFHPMNRHINAEHKIYFHTGGGVGVTIHYVLAT